MFLKTIICQGLIMKNPHRLLTYTPGLLMILLLGVISLVSCGNHSMEGKIQKSQSYIDSGDYDKALETALEAKSQLNDETPDEIRLKVYSLLGHIYYVTYKRDQAHPYLKASLELSRQSAEPGELAYAYRLWNYALTLSNIDSVSTLLSECRDVSRRDSMTEMENRARLFLGKVAILRGNYPEAHAILDTVSSEIGDNRNLYIDLMMMRSMLLSKTGRTDEAIENLKRIANDGLSLDGKKTLYELLSQYSRQAGDYKTSVEYRDRLDTYVDSIHSFEMSESAARIERELSARIHREQQMRQTIAIIGAGVAVVLLLIIFFLHKNRRHKAHQLKLIKEIAALNVKLTELTAKSEADANANDGNNTHNTTEEKERSIMEKFRLNLEFLKTLPAYSLLQRLSLERNPDDIDRKQLREAVDTVIGQFADSCTSLRQLYPMLTADDGLYCILSYAGLSKECVSAFLSASDDALRRRKSRIKQKMSADMFGFLFQ